MPSPSTVFARSQFVDQTPGDRSQMVDSLRERFNALKSQSEGLLDRAQVENRALTESEQAENDRRFGQMTSIQATLKQIKQIGGTNAQFTDTVSRAPTSDQPWTFAQIPRSAISHFVDALNRWAADGSVDPRFATITTEANIMLPKELAYPSDSPVLNAFRDGLAALNQRAISTNTSADVVLPQLNFAPGSELEEDATSSPENEPDVDQSISLPCRAYESGYAWFSGLLMSTGGTALVDHIQLGMSAAKESQLEKSIADAIIADAGITQIVRSVTTNGILTQDLLALRKALRGKHRKQRFIVLSESAFEAADGLVDSNGNPILEYDSRNQGIAWFQGVPITSSPYFQALGADDSTIGAAISCIGFRLRDAGARLARSQIAARSDQVGFNLVAYHAFGWGSDAIATLKTPTAES